MEEESELTPLAVVSLFVVEVVGISDDDGAREGDTDLFANDGDRTVLFGLDIADGGDRTGANVVKFVIVTEALAPAVLPCNSRVALAAAPFSAGCS